MKDFLLESVGRLDLVVWILVIMFFCGSALIFEGDIQMAFIGSGGIIFEMLLIAVSIEIIIETLKNTKGIGTITGFITNGPEAVCLLVGLAVGDIIFASSTPLGSNFMNPLLLFCAAFASAQVVTIFNTHRIYTIVTVCLTAALAFSFYLLSLQHYLIWLVVAIIISSSLFLKRPGEALTEDDSPIILKSKFWLIPSIIILTIAGYFLDPVVSFAAEHSQAPKGVIGFVVLATLTSWPEFKSSLALLNRNKPAAAILNITVSNITNIWLAVAGIGFYLITLWR